METTPSSDRLFTELEKGLLLQPSAGVWEGLERRLSARRRTARIRTLRRWSMAAMIVLLVGLSLATGLWLSNRQSLGLAYQSDRVEAWEDLTFSDEMIGLDYELAVMKAYQSGFSDPLVFREQSGRLSDSAPKVSVRAMEQEDARHPFLKHVDWLNASGFEPNGPNTLSGKATFRYEGQAYPAQMTFRAIDGQLVLDIPVPERSGTCPYLLTRFSDGEWVFENRGSEVPTRVILRRKGNSPVFFLNA